MVVQNRLKVQNKVFVGDPVPHAPDGCPSDLRMRFREIREALFNPCGGFAKDDKVHGYGSLRFRVIPEVGETHPVHKIDRLLGSGLKLTKVFKKTGIC